MLLIRQKRFDQEIWNGGRSRRKLGKEGNMWTMEVCHQNLPVLIPQSAHVLLSYPVRSTATRVWQTPPQRNVLVTMSQWCTFLSGTMCDRDTVSPRNPLVCGRKWRGHPLSYLLNSPLQSAIDRMWTLYIWHATLSRIQLPQWMGS